MLRFNDNTTYHGNILVGADGAHSAVRQHLFKILKAKNLLPASDEGDLPFDCVCLVGQTEVMDLEEFLDMKLAHCKFNSVLGTEYGEHYLLGSSPKLNSETSKHNDAFRNSEWGPEAADAMCNEIRHFKIP
ncbi:hypothetical protein BG003_005727 [Podila horticola]|nr:hypothetical protein BG003_005727 [Podila horticola]